MQYLFDAWCQDPRPLLFTEFLEEIELSGFELPQSLKEIAARPEVRAAMEHKDSAH